MTKFKELRLIGHKTSLELAEDRFEEAWARLEDTGSCALNDKNVDAIWHQYSNTKSIPVEQLESWAKIINNLAEDEENRIEEEEYQTLYGNPYDLEFYGDQVVRLYH